MSQQCEELGAENTPQWGPFADVVVLEVMLLIGMFCGLPVRKKCCDPSVVVS